MAVNQLRSPDTRHTRQQAMAFIDRLPESIRSPNSASLSYMFTFSISFHSRLISILRGFTFLLMLSCSSLGAQDDAWVQKNLPNFVKFYRHLHSHPELSFQEKETAKYLAAKWKSLGAEVTEGVGGHGIVGVLSNGKGPVVMIRTDLDALPVFEETGIPYASRETAVDEKGKTVPVMHACGHDIHMTNVTAVLQFLSEHQDLWSGTLVAIGQPAEERGAGAAAMLEDGLFKRFPRPDYAIALHVDSFLPTGKISVRRGYALANVDSVDVTIRGKGGHGAAPHTTIDPIVQAAEFVVAVQQIVSREIKPIEPAVITVGSIHGGTKHNIIANECHLQLTVRSYSDKVRKQLIDGIRRKAKAVALGANAPEPRIKVSEGTPSLYNNEALTDRLTEVFQQKLGKGNVVFAEPVMGGEDFSRYGRAGVPILMYRLGAVSGAKLQGFLEANQVPPSLHSSKFYPDEVEKTLTVGIKSMSAAVINLLPRKN